jgi:hypothetical protein
MLQNRRCSQFPCSDPEVEIRDIIPNQRRGLLSLFCISAVHGPLHLLQLAPHGSRAQLLVGVIPVAARAVCASLLVRLRSTKSSDAHVQVSAWNGYTHACARSYTLGYAVSNNAPQRRQKCTERTRPCLHAAFVCIGH